MGMTEQQREIALRVAATDPDCIRKWISPEQAEIFAERFIAALPKPKPFGYVYESISEAFDSVHCGTIYSLNADDGRIPLYSEPVIATPVVEQATASHEDTERLNYLIKSWQIVLEVNGEYFTYNHTSGRSGPAMATPRAAIDALLSSAQEGAA